MNKNILKYSLICILVISFIGKTYGQEFPVEIIKYSGPPNELLNIVVMGDGYTSNQQEKFIQDANNAFNGFFTQAPFSIYKDSINVFAIKVVSNEEGASMDPNNLIDNYFGSSFWSYGIERLLEAWNYSKIISVLSKNTPFYDEAVIIVNHTKYGGSGGQFAVLSTHSEAIELLLHEFGHSFADLGDEYWAGDQYASEKTNRTQDNDPETIRWKSFLNVNGIGIYPYEESPTWFRPHQNCKMRYLGSEYCDVCNNKISRDIENISNNDTLGIPIGYFTANNLEIEIGTSINFYDLSVNRPKSREWTFEGGNPETSNEKNPTVLYESSGEFLVSLKVTNEQGENTVSKTNYIKVGAAVSTNKIDYLNLVNIYPNPVHDNIIISNTTNLNPTKFRIINSIGMVVKEGKVENHINVSGLSNGVYIIQIEFKDAVVSRKLIKE